jgi:hypothetical protein
MPYTLHIALADIDVMGMGRMMTRGRWDIIIVGDADGSARLAMCNHSIDAGRYGCIGLRRGPGNRCGGCLKAVDEWGRTRWQWTCCAFREVCYDLDRPSMSSLDASALMMGSAHAAEHTGEAARGVTTRKGAWGSSGDGEAIGARPEGRCGSLEEMAIL